MIFNHIGIPTTGPFSGEIPLPHLKITVSDHQDNPYGIQWQRYWDDAPYPELVKTVPHVAFEVTLILLSLTTAVVLWHGWWRAARDLHRTRASLALTRRTLAAKHQRIAEALVGEGLAACVNVLPRMSSVYRWRGEVARGEECLLMIKTTEDLFGAVRDRIMALHAYELPEILAVPVTSGLAAYLDWIDASVTHGSR